MNLLLLLLRVALPPTPPPHARAQGVAHARLPIGEHMQLSSSRVLATNHVVELLLAWGELRDWKGALERVVPLRKRKAQPAGSAREEGDQGEEAADDEAAAGGGGVEGEQQQQQQERGGAVA